MKEGDILVNQWRLNRLSQLMEEREQAKRKLFNILALYHPHWKGNKKYWEQALTFN